MKTVIKGKWFRRFLKYIVTWRKHRKAIKQLNTLTDYQLKDIGLTRGMIDYLIWQDEDRNIRGRDQ